MARRRRADDDVAAVSTIEPNSPKELVQPMTDTGPHPEDPKEASDLPPWELTEDDLMKIIFYSPAGHGKTTLLGTGVGDERISPMLILDFEGGLKSIRSKILRVPIDQLGVIPPEIDRAHVVKISEWEDFQRVYDILESGQHEYRAVAVDSLSEVNYLNLSTIVGKQVADPRVDHDPDIPYQEDYLRSISQMRRLIRFFRDLPMHVFFTSGAVEAQDAKSRKFQYRPALTGKLVTELPGLVDTIAYLAVVEDGEENYRSLYFQPTERFMAKDRSEGGCLGAWLDLPNATHPALPTMLDRLMGVEAV